ncbi:glycosyltransferase 87 family protein [Kitasatospora sp. NPDC056327]|uniref:glycosyltransferase 87 family protein n=1 Tax=Kitasatospora sp. NPDC056327 TaxID=3345785 RepID=UPI0035D6662C
MSEIVADEPRGKQEPPAPAGADPTVLALAGVTAVSTALLVRFLLLKYESADWYYFLGPWYRYISDNGGFGALGDTAFSDYNVPYLYFMAALTYLPVPGLTGIKYVSVVFDLILAAYTYRIVALRWRHRPWRPFAAAVIVLFLPTVVTNSGWWGQADGVFTAFLVGGVYYVLRERPWWACSFFGVALAFKLQAVFLFPLLLVLLLTRRIPWRSLLAVPAVYLLLDVPAFLLGSDPWKLLTVYTRQTGVYQDLTLLAPSVYQFVSVPAGEEAPVRRAGVVVAGVLVLALVALAVRSGRRAGTAEGTGTAAASDPAAVPGRGTAGRRTAGRGTAGRAAFTGTQILLLAALFSIAVPFLLPSMHERYFYLADILSVIVAFQLPRQLWYVPVLVQLSSFGSYLKFIAPDVAPYLSMPAHGVLMLLALMAVLRATVQEFRAGERPAAGPLAGPGTAGLVGPRTGSRAPVPSPSPAPSPSPSPSSPSASPDGLRTDAARTDAAERP